VRTSDRGCKNAFAAAVLASFIAVGSPVWAADISGGVVKIGVINDATGPLSDLALALETTKVNYAGYWSAEEGRRVTL
jgi:hypothetical protein